MEVISATTECRGVSGSIFYMENLALDMIRTADRYQAYNAGPPLTDEVDAPVPVHLLNLLCNPDDLAHSGSRQQ